MALTITLVQALPARQRYKVVNSSGGGTTDTLTQATIAGNGVAGQPIRDLMSQSFGDLAAWVAAAFEGANLRVQILGADAGLNAWSVYPTYAGGGVLTISSAGNGTAYLDIVFDYSANRWPPI
jgi:hypothetical protein